MTPAPQHAGRFRRTSRRSASPAPRGRRPETARRGPRALLLATGLALLVPLAAAGEILQDAPGFTVSGTGPRASRRCKVSLKPSQTTGGEAAPHLTLQPYDDALTVGLERPEQYGMPVIVQGNQRKPFAAVEQLRIGPFRLSQVGQALRSRRLFFVTASLAGSGSFVSSRYENVDFDAILAAVGAACPFDAEILMGDTARQEREENGLALSTADLTLLRWALSRRYGDGARPEPRASLTAAERTSLKRYARENDLPQTLYLTRETSRRLVAEGQRLGAEESRLEAERRAREAEAERQRQAERAEAADRAASRATVGLIATNRTPFQIVSQVQTATYKFFWPAKDRHWRIDPGNTIRQTLTCRAGEQLCYGAQAESNQDIKWGVSLKVNSGCENCCFNCEDKIIKYFAIFQEKLFTPWQGIVCNKGSPYTNIREGPNRDDFRIVAEVRDGMNVQVVDEHRNALGYLWLNVLIRAEGRSIHGWVYANFVKTSC